MSKVCHDIVHVSYLYGQIDRLMTDTVEATCTSWCKKLANRLSKIYFMETVSIFCNCEINDRYLDIYTVRPPSLLDTKKIKKLADRLSYTDYYTQRDHLHFSMQKIGWQIIKISSPCQYFTQIDSPASSPRNWHFSGNRFHFLHQLLLLTIGSKGLQEQNHSLFLNSFKHEEKKRKQANVKQNMQMFNK